jgi:hypothetical protein
MPLTGGAVDMVVQSDGASVCVGSTGTTIELVRFTSDGKLDTNFGQAGDAGRASVPSSLSPMMLALLPDGSFAVAVEDPGSKVGVARFTSAGVLDTAFGVGGFSVIPTNANDAMAIAVDTAGRIVIGVGSAGTDQDSILLARFLP